jgi:hypothetical protein
LKFNELFKAAESLPKADPRRIAFLAIRSDPIATSLLSNTPSYSVRMNSTEFRESFSVYFGLPSPAARAFIGTHIPNNEKSKQLLVDKMGFNVKTVTGMKGDHIRIMHDNIHQLLSEELSSAKILKKGSPSSPCKNMFAHLINNSNPEEVARHTQGIIPDIVINATAITGNPKTIYDDKISITDIKTLAPGTAYNTTTNIVPNQAVNNRSLQVHKDYALQAKLIDEKLNNVEHDAVGPVQKEPLKYGENGKVIGLVFGAFGDCSSSVHDLINLISRQKALQKTEDLNIDIEAAMSKTRSMLRKKLCLFISREWARVLLERLSYVANRKYLSDGEELIFTSFRRNHHSS